MSYEDFTKPTDEPYPAVFERVKRALDNPHIIFVIRRVDDFLVSFFRQQLVNSISILSSKIDKPFKAQIFEGRTKDGNMLGKRLKGADGDFYGLDVFLELALRGHTGLLRMIQFDNLIAILESIFGKDRILVLRFDTFRKDIHKFMNIMCSFVGCLPLDNSFLSSARPAHVSDESKIAEYLQKVSDYLTGYQSDLIRSFYTECTVKPHHAALLKDFESNNCTKAYDLAK